MENEDEVVNGGVPCSHFGIEVSFDMEATAEQEEYLVSDLQKKLRAVFENWKFRADEIGIKIMNVDWE